MKKTADVKFLETQGMYLTTEQAAKYLGLTERHLRNLRREGKGPKYEHIGNRRRVAYKRSELIAWHYAFKTEQVKVSEAKTEVEAPLIDYELYLEGENVINLAPNIEKAVSAIRNEIIKNCADGYLCFEYRYCGLKAQLHINKIKYIYYAKYVFTAE